VRVAWGQSTKRGVTIARAADGRSLRKLSIAATPMAWSPDGRSLLLFERGGNLGVVRVDGSRHRRLANVGNDTLGAAWADRRTVVFSAACSRGRWVPGARPYRCTA